MFSRMKKELKSVNEMWFLALLLAASSAIFITAGCGTWNEGTGPTAGSTHTPTATITVTSSITPTATATATATATNTPLVAACTNPAAVVLGGAGIYAILSGTAISDVPTSAVTGNIANAGLASAIGIPCSEMSAGSTIFAITAGGPACAVVDATNIGIADTDRQNAYVAANNQAACVTDLGAGTLYQQTLTRGVYKFGTGVTITSDLHLDALGDAGARWIFQISGNLALAAGMTIVLDNGAVPENVVWTVAGAVEIRTTSHFEGTILGQSTIALLSGASVHGRLLTYTDVTLIQNAVTAP